MTEVCNGAITIDGADFSTVGFALLLSSIGSLPQDPDSSAEL